MSEILNARAARIAALAQRTFDLLVIGGGITGSAVARDAALRGLTVALVEKGDFGSGTSSRSSRLIHGGIRYLEHGHVHLVFESSAERHRLLRLAPHLVRPLAFTWPVYSGARIPRWKLGAGLTLYDALALFRNVERHQRLSAQAVLELEPRLRADCLLGGARYFDAATNDARLTLANAIGAAEAGAIVVNHAAVTSLLTDAGRVIGVRVSDAIQNSTIEVRAKVVVNATGPWSDSVQRLDSSASAPRQALRGSKGSHIAVPRDRIGNNAALTLLSPSDGRVLFILPANNQAIVGTTDTFATTSPDETRATNEDVRYLLDSANAFFPRAALTSDDVVSAWAGIRPLLPTADKTPGAATREHAISTSAHGMISITGGKLTTYRVMARDVVAVVLRRLGRRRTADQTKSLALPGGDFASFDHLVAAAEDATKDSALAKHLVAAYGSRWPYIFEAIAHDNGAERLTPDLPYTIGELRYSAQHEMALTLGDLLIRRTHAAFEMRDHAVVAAEKVAAAMAPLLGWDNEAKRRAVDAYAKEVESTFAIAD